MGDVGSAMNRIAAALETATKQRAPVDEFYGAATESLHCVRTFLNRWGLPILASIPGVLVTVGAISPNAAKALAEILRAVGAQ